MHHCGVNHRLALRGQILIILTQAAKLSEPGKGALNYPAFGQQQPASLVLTALDNLQFPAVATLHLSQEGFATKGTIDPDELQTLPQRCAKDCEQG